MSAISSQDIISILKEEIENYDFEAKDREIGHVIWVGDGIATVYGIDQAMYGEIVVFENGVKGMVQDVRRNEIGVILFGRDTGIKERTKVTRTKKKAGIPVGDKFVGRIINALGYNPRVCDSVQLLRLLFVGKRTLRQNRTVEDSFFIDNITAKSIT